MNKVFHVEAFGHDERSTKFATGGCCDSLVASDYKQPIIVAYETRSKECFTGQDRATQNLSKEIRQAP